MSGGGKGGGGDQVIGYRYLMGLHMGLCRGPVDEIVQIRVGDKGAWVGSVSKSQTTSISAYTLFGGDKGEGGVEGPLDIMMGDADQPQNPKLADMLNGYASSSSGYRANNWVTDPPRTGRGVLVPAFRGVVTMFFNGIITALNPYPKTWKVRVRRTKKGWTDDAPWYPEKATIWLRNDNIDVSSQMPPNQGQAGEWMNYIKNIQAMNGAHILYEAATNAEWGRGLDPSVLNLDSYRVAADTLFNEGFGLCLRWSRTDQVSSLVQSVLDHIGGAQYLDRTTGLITLRLIREDYDVNALPLFTPDSGLISILEDTNSSADIAPNEIVVKWHDPITDSDGQVREQNLASIQSQQSVNSQSREYLGLPTSALARRVALRDLRSTAGGLKRYKVQLDRRARSLAPADVFRVSDPARGISNIVLRVGDVDDGRQTEGVITISGVQDVFGLPASGFTEEQNSGWTPPDSTARPVQAARLLEIPYRDLVRAVGAAEASVRPVDACHLAAVALRPTTTSLAYVLESRPDGADKYITAGTGSWAPTGTVVGTLSRTATTVALDWAFNLAAVEIGGEALIDDEIVRVDAVDLETNTITIARGCVDTIPQLHAAGARVWFVEGDTAGDRTEYLPFETVFAKLLTRTSSQQLDPAFAPEMSIVMAQRQGRPYVCGNVKVNGQAWFNVVPTSADWVVTWSHRDRITQQDQLVDHTAADIGPETGVTYTARVYNALGTLVRTYSGISANSWSYPRTTQQADGLTGMFTVVLLAVRGGLESLSSYTIQGRVT